MKYVSSPQEIETLSFSITESLIEQEGYEFPPDIFQIARRIVHTGGYVSILRDFSYFPNIVDVFEQRIREGACIVTDTEMAKAGINRGYFPLWSGKVRCYLHDEDVVKEAKERGITRAMASCDKAVKVPDNKIFVVGNAPTFLFRLLQHYDEGLIKDIIVIGVPVGFVGAKESKEELVKRDIPYITIHGTRGGTTYGVAIINALFRILKERNKL